ncbi:uncharacterized protein LOC124616227, partial [Schistocerca americana]
SSPPASQQQQSGAQHQLPSPSPTPHQPPPLLAGPWTRT